MKIRELLRLAGQNIIQNKFKAILTSAGIIAGSATIVMVIAVGRGARMDVEDQFRNLNAGDIDISCQAEGAGAGSNGMEAFGGAGFGGTAQGKKSAGKRSSSGKNSFNGGGMPNQNASSGKTSENGMSVPQEGRTPSGTLPEGIGEMPFFAPGGEDASSEWVTLQNEDAQYLSEQIEGVSEATISYTARAAVDGGSLEEETVYTVAGVKENYAAFSNLALEAGEFISEADEESKEKICILGANAAEEIFGSAADAYGNILYIEKRIYAVGGILEAMGSVASGISPDDAVFIPYATGIKYLTGENINPTLTILAEKADQAEDVIAKARDLLEERYPGSSFAYSDAGSKMETARASGRILELLLAAMAVIVFIAGGIGIMNVLFLSVKERTEEIGILKALGCSRSNILLEFLFEAAAVSTLGGVLGILASGLLAPLLGQIGIRAELAPHAFAAALAFSVATGTMFGFYPAYRASRMMPAEALNAD